MPTLEEMLRRGGIDDVDNAMVAIASISAAPVVKRMCVGHDDEDEVKEDEQIRTCDHDKLYWQRLCAAVWKILTIRDLMYQNQDMLHGHDGSSRRNSDPQLTTTTTTRSQGRQAVVSVAASVQESIALLHPPPPSHHRTNVHIEHVLVTGSLYIAGDALSALNWSESS
jgi:hypothetical protein